MEGKRERHRDAVFVYVFAQRECKHVTAISMQIQCGHKLIGWSVILRPDLADGVFLPKAVARCIIAAPSIVYVNYVDVRD